VNASAPARPGQIALHESPGVAIPLAVFAPFVLLLAVLAADLAISAWCLAALALIGGALRGAVTRVARGEPALLIDDEGFEDLRTGIGRVPWSDVRSIQLISGRKHHVVHVALGDPDRYANMTMYGMLTCRLERHRAGANLFLGAGALRITARELASLLEARWRATRNRLPQP
jgi:hypothetical protein